MRRDLAAYGGLPATGSLSDEPEILRNLADSLKKHDWTYGYVSAIDSHGRTIWIVDAHRDDGKRFVVRAHEILTAFLELEAAVRKNSIETSCLRLAESRSR